MRSVEEMRRRLRAAFWSSVGSALSVAAFARLPEWLHLALIRAQQKAFFEWSGTRDFTTPRCVMCTQPLPHDVETEQALGISLICSPECRERFLADVKRNNRSMPAPWGPSSRRPS